MESKMLKCLSGSWTFSDPPVAEDCTSAATSEAPWGVRWNRRGKLQREISSCSVTILKKIVQKSFPWRSLVQRNIKHSGES